MIEDKYICVEHNGGCKSLEKYKLKEIVIDVNTMVSVLTICIGRVWTRLDVNMMCLAQLQSLISLKGDKYGEIF